MTRYSYYGIISACLAIPGIFGGILFAIYFHAWNSNSPSQLQKVNKLPTACMLQIVSIIGMTVFTLVFYFTSNFYFGYDFVRLVYCLILCSFFFYFAGICKRWVNMQ